MLITVVVNGVFNWTVGTELRYKDFRLYFMLNDTSGFATFHDKMIIYYCGCEQFSQCDFSDYNENSTGKHSYRPEILTGFYDDSHTSNDIIFKLEHI